jgi:hypothetical protein
MKCLGWLLEMSQCRYYASKQQAVLGVPMTDRWQIHRRLHQLSIQSVCDPNGSLIVEVNNGVAIAQIHSVVRQIVGSRSTLLDWLEACWAQPLAHQTH